MPPKSQVSAVRPSPRAHTIAMLMNHASLIQVDFIEAAAALIDAELKPLLDAVQHVVADNYPSVIAMRMLRDELSKWAGE